MQNNGILSFRDLRDHLNKIDESKLDNPLLLIDFPNIDLATVNKIYEDERCRGAYATFGLTPLHLTSFNDNSIVTTDGLVLLFDSSWRLSDNARQH